MVIVEMGVERDWLWKTAIPRLRHWCAGQCVKFLVIDLPWDLHHSAPHQSSSSSSSAASSAVWKKSLRLTELDRCQKLSIGPDFVVCICFVVVPISADNNVISLYKLLVIRGLITKTSYDSLRI